MSSATNQHKFIILLAWKQLYTSNFKIMLTSLIAIHELRITSAWVQTLVLEHETQESRNKKSVHISTLHSDEWENLLAQFALKFLVNINVNAVPLVVWLRFDVFRVFTYCLSIRVLNCFFMHKFFSLVTNSNIFVTCILGGYEYVHNW